jgi:hypothetical protein
MTEYFSHLRGGTTTYVPSDGNSITAIRHLHRALSFAANNRF